MNCKACQYNIEVFDGSHYCRYPFMAMKPSKDREYEVCEHFAQSAPWVCDDCIYRIGKPNKHNRCSHDPKDNRLQVFFAGYKWDCFYKKVHKQLTFDF